MSIATEISRIQSAKADIKTAIEAKGVTVPSSATIDTYDDYVSQISGGGGGIPMPSNLSEATLDNYGLLTSASIKSGVTTIGDSAFYNCSSLSSVTISNSVTSIGDSAFYFCSSLSSVTIPDSVTTIGDSAFRYCSNLTNVTIPNSVTSIGNSAFRYCHNLTSITVNSTTPPTLGGTYVFNNSYCPIYVPSGSVDTYKSATNWSTYASRIEPISSK